MFSVPDAVAKGEARPLRTPASDEWTVNPALTRFSVLMERILLCGVD